MSESTDFQKAPLLRLRDALCDFDRDALAAHTARSTGQARGPQSGFASLDRHLGEALAPGVHGIQGNAGAGKTAFALQLAARCGFPALFVTCEMAPGELLRRHAARETGTFLGKFKTGELAPDVAHSLALRAIERTPGLCFLDATRAPAPRAHLAQCAQIVKGKASGVLVVVDSLQSWAEGLAGFDEHGGAIADFRSAGEYETLNLAVKALRGLAHELNAPVVFVSEQNRDGMKSGGLNAGAGTRKIEYGAETIFDLSREMNTQFDGAGEVEVKLRLAKNRHGAAGVEVPLKFNGALQQFRELNTGEAVERAVTARAPLARRGA